MKKNYDNVKNVFDDIEQAPIENQIEDSNPQNEGAPSSGSSLDDSAEFLEKILEIIRNIENLQEQNTAIQKEQKAIQKRLDGYKDMKVGLSPTDKSVLAELPKLISQEVNRNVGDVANKVNVAITKHAESTIESVNKACDMRIEKAKKELGADKGIYLSWWNFWAMFVLSLISVAYSTYTAFKQCQWGRIWEELWFPFAILMVFSGLIGLIFYLNYRENMIPKY